VIIQKPKILFLHRNTLGQFEFFGTWLAQHGWDVTFALGGDAPNETAGLFRTAVFPLRAPTCDAKDFRYSTEFAAQNAASAAAWMMNERDQKGYHPDIVIAHVGWGVGLCVRQIWHHCRYIAYHEWFYTDQDWSKGGKVERPSTLPALISNRLRNLPITAEFDSADENWCPTNFQANRFPPPLRKLLCVVRDGIDCESFKPAPQTGFCFDGRTLSAQTPIITYTTRGFEPLRGFPQFMRALARLQSRNKALHAVVLGDDRVAYGAPLPEGQSWRKRMLGAYEFEPERLLMSSRVTRGVYLRVLQASWAHIYFTEPFVTSWSLGEAMAAGCLVIGSHTEPVAEWITDMETGILVDMDDPIEISDMVEWVLEHPDEVAQIRLNARMAIQERFDAAHLFPQKEARLLALLGHACEGRDTPRELETLSPHSFPLSHSQHR